MKIKEKQNQITRSTSASRLKGVGKINLNKLCQPIKQNIKSNKENKPIYKPRVPIQRTAFDHHNPYSNASSASNRTSSEPKEFIIKK